MPAIRRPGVEVTQEFVTASVSVIEPTLSACLIGACFQIVSAFDDDGNPQAAALAGVYRDGVGTVSYDLPSLRDQADLTGFEDDVRVFLVTGNNQTTELNGASDEVILIDDATPATYTALTRRFVDTGALFEQTGLLPGDVVRLTWRGDVIDVPIDTVVSDTQLTLEAGFLPEDLSSITYDVVRSPAQFVISTTQQADVKIGLNTNYIRFLARTVRFDGTTPAEYVGSLGDGLSLVVTGSQSYVTASDGAVGDTIFKAASGDFLNTVGARGAVSNRAIFLTTAGDGDVLRDIVNVVSGTQLTIESGFGVGLGSQTWVVGTVSDTGTAGATNAGGTTFTGDAGETFLTSIPNAAGSPNQTTFIEIAGVGIYPVTAVLSNTQLTITGTVATQNLTGRTYSVLLQTETGSDGTTGALTDFASIAGDLSTIPASVTSKSVVRAEVEAKAIASVTNADNLVVSSSFATSANGLSFTIPDTAAPLSVSFDQPTKTIYLQLLRTAGLSASTYTSVASAINSALDSAFNPVVSDIVSASIVGAGSTTLDATELGTYLFDGGSDATDLLLDADLLGSATPVASVYVSYKALRRDVSDGADTPTLLSFENTIAMDASIGPIDVENPLALGFFFALANAPTSVVKGIGVSDVTASKPFGTLEAYTSALEFLEGRDDVYYLVPLTQDPVVHGVTQAHVNAMSAPESKGERVCLINQPLPSFSSAQNIASGTTGNTGTVIGQATAYFETSSNLTAAGVQAGDILVVTALSTVDDSPNPVNGTIGPLFGIVLSGVKSDDDFVAQFNGTASGLSTDWNALVDVAWTIYRPGTAITSKAAQAEGVAAVGEGFADRRVGHIWPDEVFADVNGTNLGLPGFYLAAGVAGKKSQEPASQGLTNGTVAGFTGLSHSNGYFSNSQLDEMAGGGTMIFIQESQTAPLKCRHQLMTDVSTIQKRELSITASIDFVAKFLRLALSKQIGRFNITQSFLDALATAIQGLGRFLVESKIIAAFDLVSIEQNEDQLDTVNITAVIEPLYPCNYILLKVQV